MNIFRALRATLSIVVCLYWGTTGVGLAATDWSPATLLTQPFNSNVSKIQITPASRWGLFRESDSISIQTTDNSAIQIFDLNGNSLYSGNPTNFTLSRGHYIVECNGDRNQFAVLPDDYAGASFLGTEADDGTDSSHTTRLAQIDPYWGRTGNGQWATVEAQQGVFNWAAMDLTVATNPGRKIIAYAGDTAPAWVNSNNFVSSYTQFVQALATRYKNQLTAVEVWNEPWYNKFPNTTNLDTFVAFYLQLLSQCRSAVKTVNPAIQVIGPAFSGIVKDEALAMTNSIALFDGWSWHDYRRNGYAPDQDYGAPNWSPALETDHLIPYFGNFATQKPLLVDELGLYGQSALGIANTTTDPVYQSNLDWYQGMCRTIKTAVMYRACGVETISPHVLAQYAQSPNPNLELYGWDMSGTNSTNTRGPHPKTSAFLMTCYWLNGATLVDYRTPGQEAFLYAWQLTNNTAVVFAWAAEGQTVPLQTGGLPQTTDIYGNTNNVTALTEEPALFFSNTLDPLTLLSVIRTNLVSITNSAPVIDPLPTESVAEGQPLQITVTATDLDRDPITYSATVLPPGATFNPATQTLSWTPATGASGQYTATFVATDSLGATDSITTTITVLASLFDGLSAHWKFDESTGTIAADSTGTNNGTLTGFNFTTNSGWVSGAVSNALRFDGLNDFVSLDSRQINLTNNFSFSLWLKPQNAGGLGAFISIDSSYQSSGLRFFVAGNSLMLQGVTAAGSQNTIFANDLIQDGVWYHLAVVYDNSILSVYVNGALQGSADWDGDFVMNAAAPSLIGTEGSYFFSGVIDDVMLFERALTTDQVQTLYQSVNLLTISQLQGTLNFARTNADTCTIRGALPLPSNYSFSNKVVTLNIGGAETSFTLNSKGLGLTGLSRFNKPAYSKTTHLWTFNAMLRNGSWHVPWAAHGLINSTIVKPGLSVTLPVALTIDGQSFTATPSRHYTSQAGRSGSAR